jgi:hypothetical protein
MAIEAKPSTAMISLENYTVARSASVANAPDALDRDHRVANLLSPLRGETWRIPSGPASVDIDLGTARTPGAVGGIRVFGLVNYNGFPGGFTVTLKSITGLGGSVVSTWSYTTYAPASVNRLVRWFVGNHDGGAAGAASRYWRIGIPYSFGLGADRPGAVDSFIQLGNVWLGDWTEIGYDRGARIRLVDPSIETKSRSCAAYHDKLWPFHEVDLKVPLLQAATLYPALKERLDVAGGTTRMLLDLHSASSADYERAHGAFYGRIDPKGGAEQTLSFSQYGDLKLSFAEDPA